MRAADMLKPTEAAVVAGVALREVNRVIDARVLPKAFVSLADGRRVAASACPLITFYVESAGRLSADARLLTIRNVSERLLRWNARPATTRGDGDWTMRDGFLTIDLAPFVSRAREGMGRLEAARAVVVSDADVLGGMPTVRGTRIPVHDIAASVAAGIPMARILAAYPALDEKTVGLAAIYAEANPARGRKRARARLPAGAAVIADRRVPRRPEGRRKAG